MLRTISLIVAGSLALLTGVLGAQSPQWQLNQPSATLTIDSLASPSLGPIHAVRCVGESITLDYQSTCGGLGWELGMTLVPGLPGSLSGGASPGGQVVNLDLGHPSLVTLFDEHYDSPFQSTSVTLQIPVPIEIYGQMGVVDPTLLDGLALSALVGLEIVASKGGPVTGPLGNDDARLVDLASTFGSAAQVSFAGTSWSQFWVNANGSVSFASPSFDSTPSASEFSSRMPRIAALWTDLDPSAGGAISLVQNGNQITVDFIGVPTSGTTNTSYASIQFNTLSGLFRIMAVSPAPGITHDTLIGVSPGDGAIDSGPVTFSQVPQYSLHESPDGPAAMVYELIQGGAPAPVTQIIFPNGDTSSYLVIH